MLTKTHILFAFFLTLVSIELFNPQNQILFLFIIVLFSVLPDIDEKSSRVGKKTKLFSFFLKHRGIVHSFLPLLIIAFLLTVFNSIYLWGVFIGYASHLLLDSLTPQGLNPFYPFLKFRMKGFIKSGGIGEIFIFLLLLMIDIFLLINL